MLVGAAQTECIVAYPRDAQQCRDVIRFCRRHGLTICPRGSGRSYGDAILNDRQVLVDLRQMNRILRFDAASGQVCVEAGTRLIDILRHYHHLGFTVPASPTDSSISVGGAMAANVNGKESWRVGNFGDQVVSFKLLTASAEERIVDREREPELFFSVIGGMGLLGIVLEVTLQLRTVPSPFLSVQIDTAADLEGLIERLDVARQTSDFVVVWLDAYARGPRLGRAVIHMTNWLASDAASTELERTVAEGIKRLATQKRRALAFFSAMRPLINLGLQWQRFPVRLFNACYFHMHRLRRRARSQRSVSSKPELFLGHNFDKSYIVPPPDVLCGPLGYTVQMTIPAVGGFAAMREILEICQCMPCPPVTTILRLHRKDEFLLSFSEDGYSLNMEFHPKRRHASAMRRLVHELIDCGIRHGTRVHLPKDSVLSREQFEKVFPGHLQFAAVKRRVDPDELFQSDMYRRLFRPHGETD